MATVRVMVGDRHRGVGVPGVPSWSLGPPRTIEETSPVRRAQRGALRLQEWASQDLGVRDQEGKLRSLSSGRQEVNRRFKWKNSIR